MHRRRPCSFEAFAGSDDASDVVETLVRDRDESRSRRDAGDVCGSPGVLGRRVVGCSRASQWEEECLEGGAEGCTGQCDSRGRRGEDCRLDGFAVGWLNVRALDRGRGESSWNVLYNSLQTGNSLV